MVRPAGEKTLFAGRAREQIPLDQSPVKPVLNKASFPRYFNRRARVAFTKMATRYERWKLC